MEQDCLPVLKYSVILNGNFALMVQLANWVEDQNFCWKLCYRASRDGWGGKDFHRMCDDVGSTLILVKCGTNIFGGFTDQSWKPKGMFLISRFADKLE